MRRIRFARIAVLALVAVAAPACQAQIDRSLILATTTSTYDSGLLDVRGG